MLQSIIVILFIRIRPHPLITPQGDGISLGGIVAIPTTKHLLVQLCLNIVDCVGSF
jgi:hypothetical protein